MEYTDNQVHFEDEYTDYDTTIFDSVSFHQFLTNPKKFDYKRFENTDLQLCTKCHSTLIESDELLCEDCQSDIFDF